MERLTNIMTQATMSPYPAEAISHLTIKLRDAEARADYWEAEARQNRHAIDLIHQAMSDAGLLTPAPEETSEITL